MRSLSYPSWLSQRTEAVGSPSRHHARAFTLLELMVVIGIIAVLLALTASSISRAKSMARFSQCRNNTRQLLIALRMYVDEEHSYPRFGYVHAGDLRFWPDSLTPYLSERSASGGRTGVRISSFGCPAFPLPNVSFLGGVVTYGYTDAGYAFQGLGEKVLLGPDSWSAASVQEADVAHPSDTIAIGDGISRVRAGGMIASGLLLDRWRRSTPLPVIGDTPVTAAELMAADGFVRKLHSGKAAVGFCDSHVEAIRIDLLFESTSDHALRRWNRDNESHREWLVR